MAHNKDIKKGNQLEREFELMLIDAGFIVDRAKRAVIWIKRPGMAPFCGACKRANLFPITKRVDIFGRFDIHAVTPSHPGHHFFFQISTEWKYGKDRIALTEGFPIGPNDHVFMCKRQPRQKFEMMKWWPDQSVPVLGQALTRPEFRMELAHWSGFDLATFFKTYGIEC